MTTAPPILVGVEGPNTGLRYPIDAAGLRLGRDPGSEVHIDDPNVSREHARVLIHNGAIWVQDAGSRNGVFVNGKRVADHKQVKGGDRVSIGPHVFEIALPAGTQPVPTARPAEPAPPPPPNPARASLALGLGAAFLLLLAGVAWALLG